MLFKKLFLTLVTVSALGMGLSACSSSPSVRVPNASQNKTDEVEGTPRHRIGDSR